MTAAGLGERSNSLNSLGERSAEPKVFVAKSPSMIELGAEPRKSVENSSSRLIASQQHRHLSSDANKTKLIGSFVKKTSVNGVDAKRDEELTRREDPLPKTADVKSAEDREFEEKFICDFTSSLAADREWKSPRPSSIMFRSQRAVAEAEKNPEITTSRAQHLREKVAVGKGVPARKVQFEQTVDLEPSRSGPRSEADSDFKSPADCFEGKQAPAAGKQWFSSTPKQPLVEDEICQEGLSHIAASPRDSFLQNVTEPTLWTSQNRTKDGGSSGQGLLRFSSKPKEGVALRAADEKSHSDDLIQNSGSYRPAKATQSSDGRSGAMSEPAPLTTRAATSNTLPPQYLDSHLHSSNGPLKSSGRPPVQYSGPFKVPEPPQQTAVEQPSLLFLSPEEAGQDPVFRTSLNPQLYMDESCSTTRLDNNRESVPGLPANQSTPFSHLRMIDMKTVPEAMGIHDDAIDIDAPAEVRIPGVCCVGLSLQGYVPLKNNSEHCLQLKTEVKSLSIDGIEQSFGAVPFIYNEVAVLAPHASEDIRVMFVPRQAGTYVAQLQLVTSLVATQLSAPRVTSVVKLLGVAEAPLVQVYTASNRGVLDFGSLPWGREKGMPLVLINKTRANIPVRLVISTIHSGSSCFSFGNQMNSNVSLISNQNRPSIASLKPTIINLMLPGVGDADDHVNPVQTVVYFRSPHRQADKVLLSLPPEEFQACLGIELDTPYSMISLGSVRLRAAVGVARLHTPTECEVITLKACHGKSIMQRIPLRNAGNIPLEISLEVTHWQDVFTIVPMQLTVEAGGLSEFLVKFEPKPTHLTDFESLLLMFVEPDGPGYEMVVHGKILHPPAISPCPAFREKPVHLLSNKQYLAWGGVPIGNSSVQSLILRNASSYRMKILLEVRDDSLQFQILSSFGYKEKMSTSKEFMIKPLEEYPVRVSYKPTLVAGATGKLQVRLMNSTFKYAIPLSGYGGVSELSLKDVQSSSLNSSWASLGSLMVGSKATVTVTVCNHGARAAYVKTIGFEDLGCKKRLRNGGKFIIQPDMFCIEEHSSRKVTIQLIPSEKEVVLCAEKNAIVTVIGFFYGDEISRQLYRSAMKAGLQRNASLSDASSLKGVNFDVDFDDEHFILKDNDIKSTKSDIDLFYSSMKQLTLALVGKQGPEKLTRNKPTATMVGRPEAENILYPKANTKVGQPLPDEILSKESDICLHTRSQQSSENIYASKPPQRPKAKILSEADWWTLHPDKLILTLTTKDDLQPIKRVQVTNYTNTPLNFDLQWPGHCVAVTPEQGIIEPKSSMIICLSAKPQILPSNTHLPWLGKVHVTCNGETKVINVQIHRESDEVTNMPAEPVIRARQKDVSRQPLTPLIAVATPNSTNSSNHLRVTQQKLEFSGIRVKQTAEQCLEIRNIYSSPVRWFVSSFVPPYIKPAVGDGKVFRVTYSVFRLPKITGILQPQQSVKIEVVFVPRERGHYSQFWEIKSEVLDVDSHGSGFSHTCKLELQGQCVRDTDEAHTKETAKSVGTSSQGHSSGKVTCKAGELTLSSGTVDFTVNTPGVQQEKKFKIGNKTTQVMQVTVLPPSAPFHVKTTKVQVKPHHYLNFPVVFLPRSEGYFERVLSLQKPSGEILTVTLNGTCASQS